MNVSTFFFFTHPSGHFKNTSLACPNLRGTISDLGVAMNNRLLEQGVVSTRKNCFGLGHCINLAGARRLPCLKVRQQP